MTKPLDPDLKAIRAINRALTELPDDEAATRVLRWVVAYWANLPSATIPQIRRKSVERERAT